MTFHMSLWKSPNFASTTPPAFYEYSCTPLLPVVTAAAATVTTPWSLSYAWHPAILGHGAKGACTAGLVLATHPQRQHANAEKGMQTLDRKAPCTDDDSLTPCLSFPFPYSMNVPFGFA
jgi:hypothetical protein